MGSNKRDLKAYVRYDGSGRVVPGSLILRRNKPKVGKWTEVQGYECCNPLVILSVTPAEVDASMEFLLKCNGSVIITNGSVGSATISGVITNLNASMSGLGTFVLVGEDTVQLTMTSALAGVLCPNGTLTIELNVV